VTFFIVVCSHPTLLNAVLDATSMPLSVSANYSQKQLLNFDNASP